MNALIVDDERPARHELRRLLRPHDDVVVVGEAADIVEAEEQLAVLPVDVMFLDIQMPGGTGFDLLERLGRVPAVVFTTAYDEYALQAFEVSALDYLLKPVRPERLARALDRLRGGGEGRPTSAAERDRRLFIRDGERCWLTTFDQVALFEAEGNYTRVYFDDERPLIRRTLHWMTSRADPASFFRASRRHLVNLSFVESVEPDGGDAYVIRLKGGQQVPVSRRQSRVLRRLLAP
jgi:two-component system LytT family response regulator